MPRYTFDSFVVNDASREAFDAAMAVAHNPPAAHNPLVLFGPTGSGKTHLLYAIEEGLRIAEMKVMRSPAADFVARMIDAIRRDEMSAFRQSLDAIDAMLLDDVWLGDKELTMRELLMSLDGPLMRGAQIVLTTHVLPDRFPALARWVETHRGRVIHVARVL